ncbi:MAG: T9SS type A sorting domain-containing protein [Bacteroidales bacterium]|nr:T9SS type A sorting domain-containing protein [Bacteroidales bacterium]
MKKLLFATLLIGLAVVANAQQLSISYQGNNVSETDTIQVKATGDELQLMPHFTNNQSQNITARILVEKLSTTETEVMSVCTGMLCMSGYQSAPFTINGNSTYEDTHIDFLVPTDAVPGLFKVTVYDTLHTLIQASFYAMVYNTNTTLGIAEAGTATVTAYPNPATSIANIAYAMSDGNGTLTLYNPMGAAVREIALNDCEGTVQLNVSDLPAGVYMYTIRSGRNRVATKKLIVK